MYVRISRAFIFFISCVKIDEIFYFQLQRCLRTDKFIIIFLLVIGDARSKKSENITFFGANVIVRT